MLGGFHYIDDLTKSKVEDSGEGGCSWFLIENLKEDSGHGAIKLLADGGFSYFIIDCRMDHEPRHTQLW